MSKIPKEWNLRVEPYEIETESDLVICEYLSEIARSSDEERQRLVRVYKQYEAELQSPGWPPKIEKCSDEEARTIYSEEVARELIDISHRVAFDELEDQKFSHHKSLWPHLEECRMDDHRERSEFISWYFFTKRTGHPF